MQKSAPKFAIAIGTGVLVAGALVLVALRGPALMLDLSAMVGMICF